MGWLVGIEPTHAGATIQGVNRFTTATIYQTKMLGDNGYFTIPSAAVSTAIFIYFKKSCYIVDKDS